MSNTKKAAAESDVGKKLKSARLERKLTLEMVSKELCITKATLKNLEDNNPRLKRDVYVIGHIRAYAEFLRLDSEKLVHEFKEVADQAPKIEERDFMMPLPQESVPKSRILLGSAALALVVGFSIHYFSDSETQTPLAEAIDIVEATGLEMVAVVPEPNKAQPEAKKKPVLSAKIVKPSRTEAVKPSLPEVAKSFRSEVVESSRPEVAKVFRPEAVESSRLDVAETSRPEAAESPRPEVVTQRGVRSVEIPFRPSSREASPLEEIISEPQLETRSEQKPVLEPEPEQVLNSESEPATESVLKAEADVAVEPPVQTTPTPEPESTSSFLPKFSTDLIAKAVSIFKPKPKPKVSQLPRPIPKKVVEATKISKPAVSSVKPKSHEILLEVIEDSWVEVRNLTGDVVVSRVFHPGDIHILTLEDDLILHTGNAGGLLLTIDGYTTPPLGRSGQVIDHLSLQPQKLLAQYPKNQ